MKTKKIEFFKTYSPVSDEYAPKPAGKNLPKWFKEMASYMGNPPQRISNSASNGTIKKCIPVLDSLSSGYLIFTHCDIAVIWDGVGYAFDYPAESHDVISVQPVEQILNHPDNSSDLTWAPKYRNPWGIKTPPGYSCLIISPMHRDNIIQIMPGIVDTDTYNNAIQLPFIIKNKEINSFIPAGTPIAQVIPFKREDWEHEITENSYYAKKTKELVYSLFLGGYKKLFWARKSYK